MEHGPAALLEERIVLLDGAMGSALIARGLEPGSCPELWNIERPDDVLEIVESYVAAGSDVVQTNTFGASPSALARHGLRDRMAEINRSAVELARRAAGGRALVAGNIGPTGRLLEPFGDADSMELEHEFGLQAAELAGAGADYISIETMMDLAEALAAVKGSLAAGLPVTACMTFDCKPRGFFTMMGQGPAECAGRLADEGACAVGANCTLGSSAMLQLCTELVRDARVPVIVKPNAGLPRLVAGRPVYDQEPGEFAADLAEMARLGARAVGGCCGADETFIVAAKRALAQLEESGPQGLQGAQP